MTENLPATTTGTKLLGRMGDKYGVDPDKLLEVLKDTVFTVGKEEEPFSDTEVGAGLILAERLDLDPFAKEIYLIRSQFGKILTIVPIDGWATHCNRQKSYDGCSFKTIEDEKGNLKSVECTMHRSDRKHPTIIEEFLSECSRNTGPWKSHPRRMLRHKAFMQAARLCYSLGGVTDPDEAAGIRDVEHKDVTPKVREMTLPENSRVTESSPVWPRTTAQISHEHFSSNVANVKLAGEAINTQETVQVASRAGVSVQPPAGDRFDLVSETAEDAERVGLKKSFEELWAQVLAAGNVDPAKKFGVTAKAGDTTPIRDLVELVEIMSEHVAAEATA